MECKRSEALSRNASVGIGWRLEMEMRTELHCGMHHSCILILEVVIAR